jgi:putative membrane protein
MTRDPLSPPKSSNELADDRTALAFTRTVVALDRTLMAWVRTAVSLISFGFTIYKFLQGVQSSAPQGLMTPRAVALVMMGLGVGALLAATLQYRAQLAQLKLEYKMYAAPQRSLTASLSAAICALGILGFVMVLFRQ